LIITNTIRLVKEYKKAHLYAESKRLNNKQHAIQFGKMSTQIFMYQTIS